MLVATYMLCANVTCGVCQEFNQLYDNAILEIDNSI